jgi:prevent-host-death family protein
MPPTFNLYDAKTHLSSLVERAAAGEEIIIAKAGKPVAKLVPMPRLSDAPRKPSGKLQFDGPVPDDFGDPLPDEILRAFGAKD